MQQWDFLSIPTIFGGAAVETDAAIVRAALMPDVLVTRSNALEGRIQWIGIRAFAPIFAHGLMSRAVSAAETSSAIVMPLKTSA